MNNITKKDIKDFVKSFGFTLLIEDELIKNSVEYIYEVIEDYYLFSKPDNYILLDWQVEDILNQKNIFHSKKHTNLIPLYKNYLRDKKIKEILEND